MKAISIKQPYASLIVEGIKDVENRTWKCPEKYMGKRILIHAGVKSADFWSSPNVGVIDYFLRSISKGGTDWSDYPKGAIIGSVEIVDCVINHPSIWAEKSNTISKVFYDKTIHISKDWKRDKNDDLVFKPDVTYNWVLANPIKFKNPIPIKGSPYFWESECEILICNQCGQHCLHNNKDVGVPNWGNPVHICEHCGNMMLESEFEYLK